MEPLKLKRIYEPTSPEDGLRILVDRLWPRGISKERAQLYSWAKEITPSAELRKAFHSHAIQFDHFAMLYRDELSASDDAHRFVAELYKLLQKDPITLIYASRATPNHAEVLIDWLDAELAELDKD